MCNYCLLGRSDNFCRLFFSIFCFLYFCSLCIRFAVSLEFGILVSGTKHKLYFQMVHLIFCVGFNVSNRMT